MGRCYSVEVKEFLWLILLAKRIYGTDFCVNESVLIRPETEHLVKQLMGQQILGNRKGNFLQILTQVRVRQYCRFTCLLFTFL